MGRQLFDRFLIFIAVAIVWLALLHALMPPRPPLLLEATTKTVQPAALDSLEPPTCDVPPVEQQGDEGNGDKPRDTLAIA